LAWTLYTCTALLIFDILVNFITSYYDKGYLITNHFKVAVNYCKNGFIYDVFCVITLVFVMSEELSS
jgi:potassium voltage-gated channel Eag-related subfamily H protein 5